MSEYINTHVVRATMDVLLTYKAKHPKTNTPMADAFNAELERQRSEHLTTDAAYDIQRYYRAARRLGWNVTRSRGAVYENGILIYG